MGKNEIPRREWPAFFQGVTRAHRGHLCSLSVWSRETDEQVRLHPLLFAVAAPEVDVDSSRIRVVLADWDGDQLAHLVLDPRHVYASEAPEAVSESVEIDGAGGRTVMTFRAAS